MTQYARPDSDITTTGWTTTPLYSKIDEASYDDADYITSTSGSGTYTCEVGLSNVTDPVSSSNHIISWRAWYAGSGSNTVKTRIYVYQGSTLIASSTQYTEGSSAASHTYTLSGAEADAITNYTDLRFRIEAVVSGAGNRYARVSWAELAVPDFGNNANVTDNTTVGESKTVVVSDLLISVTDGLTIGETQTAFASVLINVTDGITIGESETTTNSDSFANVTDGVIIGESETIVVSDIFISVVDGLTIGESATVAVQEVVQDLNINVVTTLHNVITGMGAIAYYPLDETSGTAAINYGTLGTDANGTYGGVTLDQIDAPGGTRAPYFDASATAHVRFDNTTIKNGFSKTVGSIAIWWKVSSSSDWTDAEYRQFIRILSDGSNHVFLRKTDTNNQIAMQYAANGTIESLSSTDYNNTDWNLSVVTWTDSGDEVKWYNNGAQTGATQTGIGTWTANIVDAYIGSTGYQEFWKGYLSHAAIFDKVISSDDVSTIYTAGTSGEVYETVVIGESVTLSIELNVSVSDDVVVGESVSVTNELCQSQVSDDLTIADSATLYINIDTSVTDDITVGESTSVLLQSPEDFLVNQSDNVNINEALSAVTSDISITCSDDITLGESTVESIGIAIYGNEYYGFSSPDGSELFAIHTNAMESVTWKTTITEDGVEQSGASVYGTFGTQRADSTIDCTLYQRDEDQDAAAHSGVGLRYQDKDNFPVMAMIKPSNSHFQVVEKVGGIEYTYYDHEVSGGLSYDTPYRIRIVLSGTTASCYLYDINDSQLDYYSFTVNGAAPSSGYPVVHVYYATAVYKDIDYWDGSSNVLIDANQVFASVYAQEHRSGVFVTGGAIDLYSDGTNGSYNGWMLELTTPKIRDFVATGTFTYKSGRAMGISFRCSGDGDGYHFFYDNGTTKQIRLFKGRIATAINSWTGLPALVADTEYPWTLTVIGTTYTWVINGQTCSYTDTTYNSDGFIGVCGYQGHSLLSDWVTHGIVAENVIVEDTASVVLVEPTAISISAQDDITVGESSTVSIPICYTDQTDNVTLAQTVSLEIGISLTVDDSVALEDVASVTVSDLYIDTTDDITVGESQSISITAPEQTLISVSDDVVVNDSVTVIVSDLDIFSSDDVTISEFVSLEIGIDLVVTDDVIVGEENYTVAELTPVSGQDSITLEESISVEVSDLEITQSDSVVVADTETVYLASAEDIELQVTDGLVINDTAVIEIQNCYASVVDNITIEDTSIAEILINLDVSDSVLVNEEIYAVVEPIVIDEQDSIILAENISVKVSNLEITQSDDIILTDDAIVYLESASDITVQATDDISLGDVATVEVPECYSSVSDDIIVGDTPTVEITIDVIAQDDLVVGESQSIIVSDLSIVANDDISLAEIPSAFIPEAGALSIYVGDSTGVQEVVEIYTSYPDISVTDSITLEDSANVVLEQAQDFNISCLDDVVVAETTDQYTSIDIQVSDDTIVADIASVSLEQAQDFDISCLDNVIVAEENNQFASIDIEVTDDATISDIVNVLLSDAVLVVTDDVVIGEIISVENAQAFATAQDDVILGETVESVTEISTLVIDNVEIGDTTQVIVSDLYIDASDGITIGEVVSIFLPELGVISIFSSDVVGVSESISAVTSSPDIQVTDDVAIADLPIVYVESASDILISVVDNVTLQETDSISISDLTSSVIDGIILGEVILSVTEVSVSVSDSVAVSDTNTVEISNLSTTVSDNVSLLDTCQAITSDIIINVTDDISVADLPIVYITEAGAIEISVTDNVIISDSCSIVVTALILVATTNISVGETFGGYTGVGYGTRRLSLYCRDFNFTLYDRSSALSLYDRSFDLTLEEYLKNDNTESCS